MEIYNTSIEEHNQKLDGDILITSKHTEDEYTFICENLIKHNIEATNGLLKKPGADIAYFLKSEENVIGAVLCDTYNLCLYIDVMWIDKAYRGKGYGKELIFRAEKTAKEKGCIFSHTCTFNYQSPEFYTSCGYGIFAELSDYPDGIVQYFLKKKL